MAEDQKTICAGCHVTGSFQALTGAVDIADRFTEDLIDNYQGDRHPRQHFPRARTTKQRSVDARRGAREDKADT